MVDSMGELDQRFGAKAILDCRWASRLTLAAPLAAAWHLKQLTRASFHFPG
jgi:hypothetical protein